MPRATITIEDLSAEEASIQVDFGDEGYNPESGAHRLAFMLSSTPERTSPMENVYSDDNEEGSDNG